MDDKDVEAMRPPNENEIIEDENHNKNDIILDPFNGSGTSCVAAEVLDRRWIGIELSENYTKIARERIQSFVEQKKQQKLEFENEGK